MRPACSSLTGVRGPWLFHASWGFTGTNNGYTLTHLNVRMGARSKLAPLGPARGMLPAAEATVAAQIQTAPGEAPHETRTQAGPR